MYGYTESSILWELFSKCSWHFERTFSNCQKKSVVQRSENHAEKIPAIIWGVPAAEKKATHQAEASWFADWCNISVSIEHHHCLHVPKYLRCYSGADWTDIVCKVLFNPYILTSASIFSIIFSIYFFWYWQGEFVSKASDHFLYSHDLRQWFSSIPVRRN